MTRLAKLKILLCLMALTLGLDSISYASTWEEQVIFQLDNIFIDINNNTNFWPEFNISSHPIIATFDNKHNYAYYFLPQNPHWFKRANQPLSFYLDSDEYNIDDLGWTFGNEIDGQPAFIFNLDKLKERDSVTNTLHILLHERFHIFQFENFPLALYEWKIYTGFNHVENMKLTTIEDAAIIQYLETHSKEDLKNYIAISKYRKTLNDPDSFDYEMKKENLEGMADYYGWQTAIKDPEARTEAIIAAYKKQCRIENLINCQIHNRYYFTGNAVGLALDQLDNQWKEKLVHEKKFLRTQLFDYFPMTNTEVMQRVTLSKTLYHYDEISKPIENAIGLYKSRRDDALKKWNEMNGIILDKQKMPCSLFGLIQTGQTYYINSDIQLVLGSDGTSQCSNKSIEVNYFKTPLLLTTEHNDEIQFKIESDSIFKIDNISLTAAEFIHQNKGYQFKNFYIKTPTIEIKITNLAGELTVEDGKINLRPVDTA